MRKLLNGLAEFQEKITQEERTKFANLALGQKPDALMFCCSDSRVAPNIFASTDPGDLFVVRNVGNMVSPCDESGFSVGDVSEAAALEFAVNSLQVDDIIICGHSECGAMTAIYEGLQNVRHPNLKDWLKNGTAALEKFKSGVTLNADLSPINQISQLNVLAQVEHIRSYPYIERKIQSGKLQVSAWWFDIAKAKVSIFAEEHRRYLEIDRDVISYFIEKLT
jgi:carbonic anhydrase